MNGIWILLLLILTAALPAIFVYFWFRAKKSPVTLPWFLASIAAGIVSLIAAALVQRYLTPVGTGLKLLLFSVFIRIAFIEEASRFITLVPLLAVADRMASRIANRSRNINLAFSAALGLVSGLGFALLENAFHGITDINITLLRAFTAAPLHGACGIRAGAALFYCRKNTAKAFLHFVSAVLIHGTYNLIIINPALPSALAVIIALFTLIASLPLLKPSGAPDPHQHSPDLRP